MPVRRAQVHEVATLPKGELRATLELSNPGLDYEHSISFLNVAGLLPPQDERHISGRIPEEDLPEGLRPPLEVGLLERTHLDDHPVDHGRPARGELGDRGRVEEIAGRGRSRGHGGVERTACKAVVE